MKNRLILLLSGLGLLLALPMVRAETSSNGDRTFVRAKDGLNIACYVQGKGETTLLFLHGLCGDHEYWKNQVAPFARDYRVVAIDQPGHGESGKDRKRWTIEALAADVQTVVEELKLKRVILIGHSMGGPIALGAARRLPGTVIAVIGVDTLQDAERTTPAEMKEKIPADLERDFKGTMQEMFSGLLHPKTGSELKDWLTRKAQAQNPAVISGLLRDLFDLDSPMLLKGAKVPIRCINSSGGFPLAIPTAIDTNKKYADFGAVFLDDVGHYPMLEKPAEFNQKLADVLKELTAEK